MMKSKAILPFLALVICMGVFFFPMTASAQISDVTPPTVMAELAGDTLIVQAKDDDSGVESIYINEHRFSTLVNGTAGVKLSDYAGSGQQVTVYATDAAGNRSQSVLIDNPYYVEPVQPQPTTSITEATPTPTPSAESFLPEPVTPTSITADEESSVAEEVTQSAITGQTAFTPDGGGTVIDNATGEEGKEFFTVTATDGSVYYLIIDRQRGTENVYFLSAVTRDDLTSLAEDGESTESGIATFVPEPEIIQGDPLEEESPEESEQSADSTGTIIFIIIVIAVAGGVGYYVKIVKPRKQARQEGEAEYEDEEDSGEYLFDDEAGAYYTDGRDTEQVVDNDSAARYNDTTDEGTD